MKSENVLVEYFVKVRDAASEALEQLTPEEVKEKPQTKAVAEDNFFLNYKEFTTSKLGTFQVAEEKDNDKDRFFSALNILKNANATISSRYHGENYKFSLWLYNGKIYRQKLKK